MNQREKAARFAALHVKGAPLLLYEDVSNVLIRLEEPAKFIAVDEQSNHQIVHPLCF